MEKYILQNCRMMVTLKANTKVYSKGNSKLQAAIP